MATVKKKLYIILSLCLECFRVFQQEQVFTFDKKMRNLVIFGRNKSGKTAYVDALEFALSPDGRVKRLSFNPNAEKIFGGQVALFNYRSDLKGEKGAVQIVIDFRESSKDDKLTIDRKFGDLKENKSDAHVKFLSKTPVIPIIRGEELLFFVSVWVSTKRFEGIEVWKQHLPEFKQWADISTFINATKEENHEIEVSLSEKVAKLAEITNQRVTTWSEPAILDYINNNILAQFETGLLMSKLEKSDPAFKKLAEIMNTSKNRSQVSSKSVKPATYVKFQELLNNVNQILKLKEEYEELSQSVSMLTKDLEVFGQHLKSRSKKLKKVVDGQIAKLHKPMNEYYQYIQGNSEQTIHLRLVSDEVTAQEGFNLAVDITNDRKEVMPGDYLTCAEKQSFALAFHLATIVTFNPDVPIIILDDILLSYDEESRNRITALIVEKFPEHQFIITSCDRPFCDILESRVDRDKWKFIEIIGFKEDYGPIFREFTSIEQQIKDRWAEGLSALWLMRLYLEQNFRQWAYQLKVKLPVLKDEHKTNYGLGDLIAGFQEFIKKNKVSIPRLKSIDTDTLAYLGNLFMENTGSHAQEVDTTPFSKGDEETRWREVQEFMAMMTCKSCNKLNGFKNVVVRIEDKDSKQNLEANRATKNKRSKKMKGAFVCDKCKVPLVFIEKDTAKVQDEQIE